MLTSIFDSGFVSVAVASFVVGLVVDKLCADGVTLEVGAAAGVAPFVCVTAGVVAAFVVGPAVVLLSGSVAPPGVSVIPVVPGPVAAGGGAEG